MALRGALRSILRPRPVSARRLLPLPLLLSSKGSSFSSTSPVTPSSTIHTSFLPDALRRSSFQTRFFSTSLSGATPFSSLTDTRYPKRRPSLKPQKKRAWLRPPGPYAWVQYVPGEPIPRSRPNEGSVQGRNRIKRIKQRKDFIMAEKKKRKAQYMEHKKRRDMERIERKMAAVAREKAWAERLIELQKMEEKKKAAEMT